MIKKENNFKIENGVFSGFSAEIHIPSGVKKIAPLALAPLTSMQSLVLPDTLEEFEPSHLRKSYDVMTKDSATSWVHPASPMILKEIHIGENHPLYQSKNGVLYSVDGKQLIYMPPSRFFETVEIAEGVYELCEESCCFVSAKEIVFPKSLRRIEARACCGSDLRNSALPMCEIGESAFQGCILPEFVEIYNEVISAKAFANCSSVKGIRLHDSVKLVKDEAFSCTSIEKIYIPAKAEVEENAFLLNQSSWVISKWENSIIKNTSVIIGGEAGSPAEEFATANGIKFEIVGSSDEEVKAWLGWQERAENNYNSDDLPW